MDSTPNLNEHLDDFLLGRMSDEEARAFAERAEQDPLLAQEVRLQQDIVSGLKKARTAQLKARLSQLPTPPPAGVGGLTSWQWIGVSATSVAVILGGVALYLNQTTSTPDAARQETVAQQQVYAPAPTPEQDQAVAQTSVQPSAEEATAPALTEAKPEAKGIDRPAPARLKTKATQDSQLAVVLPKASAKPLNPTQPDEEAEDNGLIDRPGIGTPASGKVAENNEVKTKPEVVIKESDVLSYQYFDNRLFLYGSFGDAIYELIELVSAKEGRRLYIFYKDRFYTVDKDVRDVTPMRAVTDPKLEAELTLLRKKRID